MTTIWKGIACANLLFLALETYRTIYSRRRRTMGGNIDWKCGKWCVGVCTGGTVVTNHTRLLL